MSDLLMRFYHRLPAAARSATATLRGLYLHHDHDRSCTPHERRAVAGLA